MSLTFISLFAGIGGFDLGLERAGHTCVAQVERDEPALGVLAYHWPSVPRFDDVRTVGAHNLPPCDIVCGGFPCQDLSVAGQRAGLAGARSGLFYEMTRIVDELRPAFLLWENVPGLLSSGRGRDFASVLLELDRIGYSGCWTMLDAQFFGLAQRRQRIFGMFARRDIGAARCAEILSLAARLPWNTPPRREARARVAADAGRGAAGDERSAIAFDWQAGDDSQHTGTGRGRKWIARAGDYAGAVSVNRVDAVAFAQNTRDEVRLIGEDLAYALTNPGSGGRTHSRQIAGGFGVRRLTPTECERLQGFPDGWTAQSVTSPQADSARYRQLGNAVAVPCAAWIGQRLNEVER